MSYQTEENRTQTEENITKTGQEESFVSSLMRAFSKSYRVSKRIL